MTPSKAGYSFSPASQSVTVNGANVGGVDFSSQVSSTWNISGTITPVSAGASTTVTLSGGSTAIAVADAQGNFVFTGLNNGNYVLTPTKVGYSFSPTNQAVVLNGNSVSGINFGAIAGFQVAQANANGSETTVSSISSNFPSNNAAGNLLIVTGTAARPSSNLTISDTAGNSYSLAVGPITDPAQSVTAYIWYAKNCKGGPNTVTLTPSTPGALEIHVSEYSGLDSFSPLDQTSFASGTGLAVSSGSKITQSNSELVFGYSFVGAGSSTVGAGFTGLSYVNGDWDEYQIQNTSGSVAASFTQSTSVPWLALMATFRPAGASTLSISGNISPTVGGSGAAITLSGTVAGTTTADASGNYSFGSLPNGSYTVTPILSGYIIHQRARQSQSTAQTSPASVHCLRLADLLSVAPTTMVFTGNQGGPNPTPSTVNKDYKRWEQYSELHRQAATVYG